MARWVRVAGLAETPPGTCRTVRAGEFSLALVNDEGRIRALDDACPHQGASLGQGTVVRGNLICPLHSWVFDIDTGACRGMSEPGPRVYPVRIAGDAVEVALPQRDEGEEGTA